MAWKEPRKTKKGVRWYVLERINGVRKSFGSFHSEKAADAAIKKLDDQGTNKELQIQDQDLTVNQVAEKYIADSKTRKKPKTIETIERSLKKLTEYFDGVKISALNDTALERFRSDLAPKYAVNGLRIYVGTIKTFFQFAKEQGYIEENPCTKALMKKMKFVKVARPLNYDEVTRLLEAATPDWSEGYETYTTPKKNGQRLELYRIIRIVLYTGLRSQEIRGLRSEWIDLGARRIELPSAIAKSGNADTVPVVDDLFEDLAAIIKEKPAGQLFPGWTYFRLRQAFQRAVKRAKIEGRVRFHDLRHTFAKTYLDNGGTLAELMVLLRHSSYASTQVYKHWEKSHICDKANKLLKYNPKSNGEKTDRPG